MQVAASRLVGENARGGMYMSDLKCASCANYLFNGPVQCPCGDRLCGDCFQALKARSSKCEKEISLDECFKDKAAVNELKTATIQCTNQDCPWEGPSKFYMEHICSCKFKKIPCPNEQYGCTELLLWSQWEEHLEREYRFIPVLCPWCSKKVHNKELHIKQECGHVVVTCPNGCGEKLPKKDVPKHVRTVCTHQIRDCDFKDCGCQFKGNLRDLNKHYKDQLVYHNQLATRVTKELEQAMAMRISAMDQKVASIKSELAHVQSEMAAKMQPLIDAVVRVERTIEQFQEGFGEMVLMVQTLQATSYSGTFIWKIPEVQRRRGEARSGRTVSLYSAPFYTSRHRYKLHLRLYMDGGGSGKSSHLSFFLTLMRREYDALLIWPFRQVVTLILLDHDRQGDIFQSDEVKLYHQEQAQLKAKQPYRSYRWLEYWKTVLLTSGDVETNPGPARMTRDQINKVAKGRLEISAHNAVYREISSLSGRWRQLFAAIGLEDSLLSRIEREYPNKMELCLLESIKHWLQCDFDIKEHELPSWRSLVAAIDHSAGGQNHALAKKIAEDHEELESDDDNGHRKAVKSKGKTSRRYRGVMKLRRPHPYMCRATPVVVNMHFHGTCIIHQRH